MSECYCRECRDGNYQGCLSLPRNRERLIRSWWLSDDDDGIEEAARESRFRGERLS